MPRVPSTRFVTLAHTCSYMCLSPGRHLLHGGLFHGTFWSHILPSRHLQLGGQCTWQGLSTTPAPRPTHFPTCIIFPPVSSNSAQLPHKTHVPSSFLSLVLFHMGTKKCILSFPDDCQSSASVAMKWDIMKNQSHQQRKPLEVPRGPFHNGTFCFLSPS